MSVLPARAAWCAGVSPPLSCARTIGPETASGSESSSLATSECPLAAAMCRHVPSLTSRAAVTIPTTR
eukprot:CAMPEP_0206279632 /NCGR_PEP_ID=MMETSP0047_2-20121206/38119_1 /ASSEMBLY_ACC=CAM_ASM_000192 /TAXON_ID=195065 /ORGANISM="Chroomonas mesostigmatica_cf, Strain CCMP1168" /LENGTH=67 /DNA_ID=CAMNT_0053709581 /DNA_START=20 /DNA_END=219 /DNA_ORIENTATION=-